MTRLPRVFVNWLEFVGAIWMRGDSLRLLLSSRHPRTRPLIKCIIWRLLLQMLVVAIRGLSLFYIRLIKMGWCGVVLVGGFTRPEHLQNLSGSLCSSPLSCHRTDTRNPQRRILTILHGLVVNVRWNSCLAAHSSARSRSKLLHMTHRFGRMGYGYPQRTTRWRIILVLTTPLHVVRDWRRICEVSQARIHVLGRARGRIQHSLMVLLVTSPSVEILTLETCSLVCVQFGQLVAWFIDYFPRMCSNKIAVLFQLYPTQRPHMTLVVHLLILLYSRNCLVGLPLTSWNLDSALFCGIRFRRVVLMVNICWSLPSVCIFLPILTFVERLLVVVVGVSWSLFAII